MRLLRPSLVAPTRITALLAAVVAFAGIAQAEPEFENAPSPVKRILVLHSYHASFAVRLAANDELRAAFAEGYELEEEFLDTKRRDPETGFKIMRGLLEEKLDRRGPPDLVIAFDDHALTFIEAHRRALFADAPVVFAAVNDLSLARRMAAAPLTAGVLEQHPYAETVALASRLNPEPLDTIIAIANSSAASQTNVESLRALTDIAGVRLEILSLDGLSFDEAAEVMAAERRPGAAYLFMAAFRDRTGLTLGGRAAITRLAARSGRPIYTAVDYGGDTGAVGGHSLRMVEHTRAAVSIARRVLDGAPIDAFPLVRGLPTRAVVDQLAAERYGLRLDALPDTVRIDNAQPGFWRARGEAITVGLLVLGGMMGVVALVYFASKEAQDRLRALNREMESRNAELEDAQARIEHQAFHDALTGLPNRRYLERRFEEAWTDGTEPADSARAGCWALLHVDLDRFKQINDTLGHAAGDHVLCEVAERIQRSLPAQGFAARIGGDEFVVLAPFVGPDAVSAYAEALIESLRRPVNFENQLCRFGASVGVALAQSPVELGGDLFRNADMALYQAKSQGRGQFAFFTDSQKEQAVSAKRLADDLLRGLEAGEIAPYFQPQISAKTGEVVGVEALARWLHPTLGVLAPAHFMGIAAQHGLTAEIDRVILSQARKHLETWRAQGVRLEQLSVNVSPSRLLDPTLGDYIRHLDFGETALCVELLESTFLDREDDPAFCAVSRLREQGVRVEIDDFGTGHASIISLLRIRPDRFKIAPEVSKLIEVSEQHEGLLRAIIDIGRALDIGVVAEGVETQAHFDFLSRIGCEVLQGYAISRPIPPHEIATFVQSRRPLELKIA